MNKNELKILRLPHKYLIFIDEVGDSFVHLDIKKYQDASVFPALTIVALIVSRLNYKKILIPQLNKIKEYFFKDKSKDVYLHSREIRRKDGIFKIFLNENLYNEFKEKMNNLIEECSIKIISCSINKIKLLEKAQEFRARSGQSYNIGDIYLRNLDYVLERVGHFLQEKTGKIIFEKRGKKEDKRIQTVLVEAKQNGTFYCLKERFRGIDGEILFFTKKDNISGLQLADYCAYPFARHSKNPLDKNNQFFDFLRKFVYKGDFGEYGLKEWP